LGPLTLKHGVNALSTMEPNLSMLYFFAYGSFSSLMVLCDSYKQEKATEIALSVWKESSMKMF